MRFLMYKLGSESEPIPAEGPQRGLELVDAIAGEPTLRHYHLLPSVRGDLLVKLGRPAEAQLEFERAAALTGNARERELSEARARAAGEQAAQLELEVGR
jgi:predicted RNA polymerase sigma factor